MKIILNFPRYLREEVKKILNREMIHLSEI